MRVAAPGPPWLAQADWRAANEAVAHLLGRHRRHLAGLKKTAAELLEQMRPLFPVLDELCAMSCRWCPEPCCLGARIWWDLRDLLFLHLNGRKTGDHQPIGPDTRFCRYLGPEGCRLDRLDRPWICTWYLCVPQKGYLNRTAPHRLADLQAQIRDIQQGRKHLENEFIRLTAGGAGTA